MQMTPRKPRVSPQKEVFSTGTGFGVDVGGSDGSCFPLPLILPSYDLARLACRGLVRRLDPATPRTDDHPAAAPPCAPGLPRQPRPAPPPTCSPRISFHVPPSIPSLLLTPPHRIFAFLRTPKITRRRQHYCLLIITSSQHIIVILKIPPIVKILHLTTI